MVRLLSLRLARRDHRRAASSRASIRRRPSSSPCWPSRPASRCGPFGALLFGRLGDLIGRKYTFLVTILLMGSSTFLVGLLPGYASIGMAAPVLLIALRLLQGLALGGEYGGAATYVAEHAPQRPARLLHLVDPDHGDARPVPVAAGHPAAARTRCRPRQFADLGLAHSVPGVDRPARRLGLDPAAARTRVAGLPADEGRGQELQGAADARPSASGRTSRS